MTATAAVRREPRTCGRCSLAVLRAMPDGDFAYWCVEREAPLRPRPAVRPACENFISQAGR